MEVGGAPLAYPHSGPLLIKGGAGVGRVLCVLCCRGAHPSPHSSHPSPHTTHPVLHARFYNKAAPWPRVAFTERSGGHCLHTRACGAVDTNKVSPVEYHDHRELEAVCMDQGFVLCHTCRADPGF